MMWGTVKRKAVSIYQRLADCPQPLKKTALTSLLSSRWVGWRKIYPKGLNKSIYINNLTFCEKMAMPNTLNRKKS